jgi:predicted metal-binding protein
MVGNTPTKLVGTSFSGRQELLARAKAEKLLTLILEREPTNLFDTDAITATVTFRDGTKAILGHIQNGDRKCLGLLPNGKDCGAIIEGGVVNRSMTVQCPGCSFLFSADRNTQDTVKEGLDVVKYTTCPKCSTRFRHNQHNIYVCKCGCYQQQRIGLASELCRDMEQGIAYKARILEVTGGDTVNGKKRSFGCNIWIEKDEANSPI